MDKLPIVIIGGGPAGIFAACCLKKLEKDAPVVVLEKTSEFLSKVRISGGGRCNVTNHCSDRKKLIENYPRGSKELLGPLSRFSLLDTMKWFEEKGVALKTEEDGRVFPASDSAETIVFCLLKEASDLGVELQSNKNVEAVEKRIDGTFSITLASREILNCQKVLFATGGSRQAFQLIESLGHTIIPPVPSLFTFNVPSSPLSELSGITIDKVKAKLFDFEVTGSLLITHWGFSGPAILKLSSFCARLLHDAKYRATLTINWLPDLSPSEIQNILENTKMKEGAKLIASFSPFAITKNLWKAFLKLSDIPEDLHYSYLSKRQLLDLSAKLRYDTYKIDGMSANKQEFVTCGGVKLSEVNFKTLESRMIGNLFFAGEVLDIDGVTGGFNFQNCWTTGYLAALGMAHSK
jgi:predicted Rossmann fold flavoprotein